MTFRHRSCSIVRAVGRAVAIVVLAAGFAGCTLTQPAPVKNTFLLDPPLPAAVAQPISGTLRMGRIGVAAPYRDRTFVYRIGDARYESDFYNEFFVAPSAMVAQSTINALTRARVFERVVPSGSVPDEGRFILEGFVTELHADARSKPAAAVVGIQYYLSRTGIDAAIVWSHQYREEAVVKEATAEALASAWSEAFGRILAALARDLAGLELEP